MNTDKNEYRQALSRTWFPELNHGKILGIVEGDWGSSSVPQAGQYGNNLVEVVEWKDLDLESFPEVEDLFLTINASLTSFGIPASLEGGGAEVKLEFKSFKYAKDGQTLAHIELYYDDMEVALKRLPIYERFTGTYEHPWSDGDQGWEWYSFVKGEFVYVLYGVEICSGYFPVWFKIRKEKYFNLFDGLHMQWQSSRRTLFTKHPFDGVVGKFRWIWMRLLP